MESEITELGMDDGLASPKQRTFVSPDDLETPVVFKIIDCHRETMKNAEGRTNTRLVLHFDDGKKFVTNVTSEDFVTSELGGTKRSIIGKSVEAFRQRVTNPQGQRVWGKALRHPSGATRVPGGDDE